MRNRLLSALAATAFAFCSTPASADFKLPAPSPLSSVTQQIGVTDVTVTYSSPGAKGRKIFGELVPYGKVWRTGANLCTKFRTEDPITVAGKDLAAGEYCLFSVPSAEGWTIIFNNDARQFSAIDYDKSKDVLRVSAKATKNDFRERMTFLFEDVTDNSATLALEWGDVAVKLPIQTDTQKLALQKIKALESDSYWDYLSAARHIKSEGKDLSLAMKLIDRSIEKEKMWFNTYVKGDILAAQGDFKKAAEYADEALKLKDDTPLFSFFEPRIEESSKEWNAKVKG